MTCPREMGPGAEEREIMAAVPAVTYRATSDTDAWTFTSVQGGLLERLGTRPEDLCGDPGRWVLMIHRADRERVIAERRRAARSGHLELEYRLQTPDGGDCWVHDVAVRDDWSDDAMCGIVIDLTEHRRADDVLEQLHDARLGAVTRLVRYAAVRDTTVQLFVHDMRSPLTAVAGLARTLHERGGHLTPADHDQVFGRMVAASDRVVALVDDFARFWDLPLHDAAIPTRRLALATLVADAIHEVGVEDDQVDVEVDDVVVETNAELLRRVIVGLVRNAMQHTPEGTGIRVAAEAGGGRVVLQVADDGPGIPEHVRHRIFEDHARVTGDGRDKGVGLNLVRAAVELLGGDVRAVEGANGGTLIRVELPDASDPGEGDVEA